MNITSINMAGCRSVNFGTYALLPDGKEPDNSNVVVNAVDKALSENKGLEMLGLVNMAEVLAKKNNICLKGEFDKIASSLSMMQGIEYSKDIELAGKILDRKINKNDEYNEQIERQMDNIEKDIAFISDFIESERFIKFVDKANDAIPDYDERIRNPYQEIDIESDGIKGTLHIGERQVEYITVPETDDNPAFVYCFPNFSSSYVKIARRLSNNERETYSYPIHNQKRKLDDSFAIEVTNLVSKDYFKCEETAYSYAWNKNDDNISLYCADVK